MSELMPDERPIVAPFPPLVDGGAGLEWEPEARSTALASRMAEIYGVAPAYVLPVRGADHGRSLIEGVFGSEAVIIDERYIEFSDERSKALRAYTTERAFILRDLSFAYGLVGAPCGAILANPTAISRLTAMLPRWDRVPTPVVRLALRALDPSRMLANAARIACVREQVARVVSAVPNAVAEGPCVVLVDPDYTALSRLGLNYWSVGPDARGCQVPLGTPEVADLVLAAMGVAVPPHLPHRTATIARDTKETRIVASVDLDRAGAREVHTGVGFFDHMLDQVAAHGGFGLTLAVDGDLHIDPHHSIEDATLALGAALKQALGDRAGIGRYGFVLPMDEAETRISVDLGGRPFSVFEGNFHASHIGEYPTALTAHVFRSLAESMGAAIHVHATGEDDHHKTEACFKALGRALRQAIRVDGGDVPSTKGVI